MGFGGGSWVSRPFSNMGADLIIGAIVLYCPIGQRPIGCVIPTGAR